MQEILPLTVITQLIRCAHYYNKNQYNKYFYNIIIYWFMHNT